MLWQLEGLTLATVIGAGHMVPTDKPAQALEILDVFLGDHDWQIPKYYEEWIKQPCGIECIYTV